MIVSQTSRLLLREFELSDAEFIHELVNDPAWLQNIGDRNVRNLSDAETYIQKLRQSYLENGFGFYAVSERETSKLVGMCGLIKRAELDHVDLGFAFLAEARGKGYAQESSLSIIAFARAKGLTRLLGIINPKNTISARVLEKVGMKLEKKGRLKKEDDLELFIYGMDL